jgi:glycogen(starch) synthase
LDVKPAFLPLERSPARIPDELEAWSAGRSPLISVTLAFRPEYGFELLVRAVAVLRLRYPGLGCVVMGGGENRADAEGFLERQGMAEAIYLVGDLDHKACLAVISRSAVFVRPTYADGDSISVREAMSLGVPVVASKVGMRPAGALLFDAGDLDGLVAQVVKILSQDRTKL